MSEEFEWVTNRKQAVRDKRAARKARRKEWNQKQSKRLSHFFKVRLRLWGENILSACARAILACVRGILSLHRLIPAIPPIPNHLRPKALLWSTAKKLNPLPLAIIIGRNGYTLCKKLIKSIVLPRFAVLSLANAMSFVGILSGIGAIFAATSRSIDLEITIALSLGAVASMWLALRTRKKYAVAFEKLSELVEQSIPARPVEQIAAIPKTTEQKRIPAAAPKPLSKPVSQPAPSPVILAKSKPTEKALPKEVMKEPAEQPTPPKEPKLSGLRQKLSEMEKDTDTELSMLLKNAQNAVPQKNEKPSARAKATHSKPQSFFKNYFALSRGTKEQTG